MHKLSRLFHALLILNCGYAAAADFSVTLGTDATPSVAGTLRQAVEGANGSTDDSNSVNFTLANGSSILLVAELPTTTKPAVINGSTVTSLSVAKLVPADTFPILHVGTARTTLKDILFSGGDYLIDANAQLALSYSSDVTISDNISGAGALFKQDAGTVTLDGTNSWSGNTTVEAGALRGNVASLPGNYTVAAGGRLTLTSFDLLLPAETFAGNITGAGSLLKEEGHDVTLTGTVDHTGGTEIAEGRLIVDPASFSSASIVSAGATLQINSDSASTVTFAGDISGPGTLEKAGTAVVTLTGTSSHLGGTSVLAGALRGTNAALQGDYDLNAATWLEIAETGTGTFAGVISGAGAVILNGSGTTTFNTLHTYTGGTSLNSGTLSLASTLPGSIVVAAGSILIGPGGITSNLTTAGTVQPSTGFDTMTVGGTATFQPGSTLSINVDPAGNHSALAVTGLTIITGGEVRVSVAPGDYTIPITYDILQASSGFSLTDNTFDEEALTGFAFLEVGVETVIPDNVVRLTVQSNISTLSDYATNTNQLATANAFEELATGTDPDVTLVVNNLVIASIEEVPDILDQLSGETLGDLFHPLHLASQRTAQLISQRFSACRPKHPEAVPQDSRGNGAWFEGFGAWDGLDGNDETLDMEALIYGGVVGIDRIVYGSCESHRHNLRLGIAAGYTHIDASCDDKTTHMHSNGVHGAAYAGYTYGPLYTGIVGQYGYHWVETERKIQFGEISRIAEGDPSIQDWAGHFESGLRFGIYKWLHMQPSVDFHYVDARQCAFEEEDADSLNLSIRSAHAHSGMVTIRNRLSLDVPLIDGRGIEPELYAGWAYQCMGGAPRIQGRFSEAPAGLGEFDVKGPSVPRQSILYGASSTWRYDGEPLVSARYDGIVREGRWNHIVSLAVHVNW